MQVNREKLKERIRECRKKAGLTQEELAHELHVKRQIISYYESIESERTPNIDILATMADLFNTTTDYLLGLTDVESTDVEIKELCEYINLSYTAVNNIHYRNANKRSMEAFLKDKINFDYTFDFLNFFFENFDTISGFTLCHKISDYKNALVSQTNFLTEKTDSFTSIKDKLDVTSYTDYFEILNSLRASYKNAEKEIGYYKYTVVDIFENIIANYLKPEYESYLKELGRFDNIIDSFSRGVDITNANDNETE